MFISALEARAQALIAQSQAYRAIAFLVPKVKLCNQVIIDESPFSSRLIRIKEDDARVAEVSLMRRKRKALSTPKVQPQVNLARRFRLMDELDMGEEEEENIPLQHSSRTHPPIP